MSDEVVDVVVIGGGLSGLAAAARLALARKVVVLEAADELGGQCSGCWSQGQPGDLGVHGIYPRYSDLEALLAEAGVSLSAFIPARRQHVVSPEGILSPVRMPPVPAPLNGLIHVALLSGLRPAERARLAARMAPILIADPDDPGLDQISIGDLALRIGIPRVAFRLVLEPLAWIGFFLHPDHISAGAYLSALRFLLIGRRDSWRTRWVPTPNGATLIRPVAVLCERRGGQLRTRCRATALLSDGLQVTGVRYRDRTGVARELACKAVVCAVQPPAAADLVATIPGAAGYSQARSLRALGQAAVRTLRFRFDRGPSPLARHGVVLTHDAGFAFLSLADFMPAFRGSRMIEVQHAPEASSDDESRLLGRVRSLLPDGARARLVSSYSTDPITYARYGVGGAASRPGVHSPWLGLFFAGDWVDEPTGAWFMERAVRTGRSAAAAILGTDICPGQPSLVGPLFRSTRSILRHLDGKHRDAG